MKNIPAIASLPVLKRYKNLIIISLLCHITGILESVHKKRGRIKTVFSNVYDISDGVVYCFCNGDFKRSVKLDINEEIEKGNIYYDMHEKFSQ